MQIQQVRILSRIPPDKIAAARELLRAVNLEDRLGEILATIGKAYMEKPWLLSGRSSAFLLSGLIYLTAKKNGAPLTQRMIESTLGYTEPSVRASWFFWRNLLSRMETGEEEAEVLLPDEAVEAITWNALNGKCGECAKILPFIHDGKVNVVDLAEAGLLPHVVMVVEAVRRSE